MKTAFRFSIDFIIRLNKKERSLALLYARLTVDGIAKEISLKEQIIVADWDSAREQVKGKSVQAKALNSHIEDVRYRLKEQYRMLLEKQCNITAEAVKEAHLGIHKVQHRGHSVCELLKYHAKIAVGNLEPGTLKNYVTTEVEYPRTVISSFRAKLTINEIYNQHYWWSVNTGF
jgi:paraquat-inducible protein B